MAQIIIRQESQNAALPAHKTEYFIIEKSNLQKNLTSPTNVTVPESMVSVISQIFIRFKPCKSYVLTRNRI